MNIFYALSVALGLICVSACGPSFVVQTPAGFVELNDEWDGYDYRATTADGLVIAAREIEHKPKGDAAFWLKAIKNSMRDRGGYALLETLQVQSADGVPGTQLRFGHDEEGNKPHLYYLTLYVTDDVIVLLEAGGSKKMVTENAAQIATAVRSFSVN